MSVNTGLSAVSDHVLMVAVIIYSLALLAYAGDFAYGRRAQTATAAAKPVSELAGVGARGAASGATGDAAGVSPGGLEKGRQPLGPLIRTAIALTFLSAATHLSGVIIRAIAVHRVPWGDMYEFVITLTCVAVLFFIAVMLRFRAWHLGLFVTGAVMVALGLAQTIIYTPAGPLVPALKSYWLALHVAAMTLSTGIFFVAAVLGVIYLFAERYERQVAAGRPPPD